MPAIADRLYRRYHDHRVGLAREEVNQRFESNLQRLYETYGEAILVEARSDTLFVGTRLTDCVEVIRCQTPFKVVGDLVGDPMQSRYGRLFSWAWNAVGVMDRQPSRQPEVDTVREELIVVGAVCVVAFDLGLIERGYHGTQFDSGRCPVEASNREA